MSISPSVTVIDKKKASTPSGGYAPPHIRPSEDLLKEFNVDPVKGLSTERAVVLLAEHGPNQLKPPAKPSKLKILLGQITNAMTIVLLGAMAVSLGTQDWIAAGVIGALVTLNVSVGYTQEWKAESVLAGLASVGSPVATVIRYDLKQKSKNREGKAFTIQTEEVVPGDIIMVKIGDIVPADARILSGYLSNLECDEALLTGESLPVVKTAETLDEEDSPVGDRTNMVYSGSQVTKGRAKCIVTMTGMNTELGKIADALERKDKVTDKGTRLLIRRVKVALGVMDTTPLQIKLNKLAYWLLLSAIILAVIVVSSTGFHDIPNSIATYAVAAAVSLLPASLIAVLSLTLAVACRELANRNALVRRMDAVETLGGVHNICSDKTGTITVGRMVVKKAWIPVNTAYVAPGTRASYDTATGQLYVVESGRDPYYPRGIIRAMSELEEPSPIPNNNGDIDEDSDDVTANDVVRIEALEPAFQEFIHGAALNNMASIHKPLEGQGWDANGDPTEIALQVFAHKAGRGKPHLTTIRRRPNAHLHGDPLALVVSRASANIQYHHQLKRIASAQSDGPLLGQIDGHYEMLLENPFDSNIKRMSTVWQFIPEDTRNDPADYELVVYVKGAVERILDRCTHIGLGDNKVALTEEHKEHIIQRMDSIAVEGLRVLCLAAKHISYSNKVTIKGIPRDELENGCSFLGLAGIYDPPRPESQGAVMESLRAGIVVRMLTGDHAATAASIARSVGILTDRHGPHAVMTGQEFDSLTDEQIDAIEDLPVVVARCAPETKVRMVEALHRRGEKTVMTGDGVNDSPALKRADVGVAMGLNGSDVAKGASAVVLADDNFSSIVRAIRKGRSVFQNLTKFLVYLLSGNVAEVVVIMIGLAFRSDGVAVYPVAPVAALWINTIAAGPPALALGVEPTAKDAMDIGPEAFQAIFTPSWYMDTIGYGIFIGAQTLANFVIVTYGTGGGTDAIFPKCNDHLVGLLEGCETVFVARGTAFATLQLILMVHAITCKNLTRSIFKMNLMDNTSLLWSAGCLALTTFPILYIPVINDHVFQLSGLNWQWGLVAARAATLPGKHPLHKIVKNKARKLVKKHRTTFHTLLHLNGIQPSRMETIAPVRRPPNYVPRHSTRIDSKKEEALEHDRDIQDTGIRIYSDGSGYKGNVGAAAVLYENGQKKATLKYRLGPATEHTVYEGEIIGVLLGLTLARRSRAARDETNPVSISLDNTAVISALNNQKAKPSHALLDWVHDKMDRLDEELLERLEIKWVPGHRNARGNEEADKAAKKAAEGDVSQVNKLPKELRSEIPVSVSALRQSLTTDAHRKWTAAWKHSPRYRTARQFQKKAHNNRYQKLVSRLRRNQTSALTQLRTNHIPLNYYLHRIKKIDSPDCPHCPGRIEDIQHYLFNCRQYHQPRQILKQKAGRKASSIAYLLGKEEGTRQLMEYMSNTRRFEQMLGPLWSSEDDEEQEEEHAAHISRAHTPENAALVTPPLDSPL